MIRESSEAVRLWDSAAAELPPGWRLTSDLDRSGFRVRAYDAAEQVWVSRWAPTFDAAVAAVRDDLHSMPLWLRKQAAQESEGAEHS